VSDALGTSAIFDIHKDLLRALEFHSTCKRLVGED
jgi:hypothetical protein